MGCLGWLYPNVILNCLQSDDESTEEENKTENKNKGTSLLTNKGTSQVQEKEVVIRIVRQTGTGLGISIAGGIGSTPYRLNDEVIILYYSYVS